MDTAFWGWNLIWLDPAQEPVGLGASIARSGPSEDSFDRICRPIAQLWDKKPVKNGPLRPLRSRRSPSPTGSWALLVNARLVKNVSGRKSDVLDCQWLQQLMTCGLLRGAFRPAEQVCVLRSLWRQRGMLLRSQARDVQNRQKALTQRNIQLVKVIADVVGETGQKILRAIVAGERDGLVLGAMKNVRSHASVGKIAKSLQGNWRAEHLFALKQALVRSASLPRSCARATQRSLRSCSVCSCMTANWPKAKSVAALAMRPSSTCARSCSKCVAWTLRTSTAST